MTRHSQPRYWCPRPLDVRNVPSSLAHPCHDSTHGCEALAAALCPDRDVDRPGAEEAAFQDPIGPERGGKGRSARSEARLNQLVSDTPTPERLRPAGHGSCSTIEGQPSLADLVLAEAAGHRSADGNVARLRRYSEGEVGMRGRAFVDAGIADVSIRRRSMGRCKQ